MYTTYYVHAIHKHYHIIVSVDENHSTTATASLKNIVSHIHNIITVCIPVYSSHESEHTYSSVNRQTLMMFCKRIELSTSYNHILNMILYSTTKIVIIKIIIMLYDVQMYNV